MNKLILAFIFLIIGIFIGFYYADKNPGLIDSDYRFLVEADEIHEVAGTGSMKPLFHKYDNTFVRELNQEEILIRGRIYVYETNNETATFTVVHRLIGYGDLNKESLIFKGDSNQYADDPILRDQVLFEVVAVCFGGYCDR